MKKHLFILIISLCCFEFMQAQEKTVVLEPKGEYAEINLTEQNEMIGKLTDPSTVRDAIEVVFKSIPHYNPIVMYQFADALLATGEKDESIGFYLYAMIMARYDRKLCSDSSAGQLVGLIEEKFYSDFKFMFKKKELFRKSLDDACQLAGLVPDDSYDHRWISLHGINASIVALEPDHKNDKPLCAPKDKWPDIKAKVIADFKADMLREISR